MRIAILQLNFTVGDLAGNADKIAHAVRQAAAQGARLCLTTELALTGYPPRDLLLSHGFIQSVHNRLQALATELADAPAVVVGAPMPNDSGTGNPLYNSAALLKDGRIAQVFHKTLLPTYDVFDEARYFEPGPGPGVFEHQGQTVAVTICEDLWNDDQFWSKRRYQDDPMQSVVAQQADIVLNLSASPFTLGKQKIRHDMLGWTAKKHGLPIVYANQVGGNDDLIFAGRSMFFKADGTLAAQAKAFEEDTLFIDTGLESPEIHFEEENPAAQAWQALVLGTRDYALKCGFKKALLGLSGGIDSALCAAVATQALGKDNVLGVLMPSPWSSQGSVDDSLALVENLSIRSRTIPIEPMMQAFETSLADAFEGLPPDTTEENIQARIRGNLLMALSNKRRSILLTTGNKSELAVGYCTIYGDMSGGLAVISDVPKMLVYDICRWLNTSQGREVIPQAIIDKAPSAELRPDQKDQDSLPPYEILDPILEQLVERRQTPEELIQGGADPDVVAQITRLLRLAEFKRRQAAPGLKITDRAFGTGWRMPLASRLTN